MVAAGVVASGSEIPEFLPQLVALVGGAALIGYLSSRLRVVPIVGFLLAGVAIGPAQLGLVESQEVVDAAAEVGVILLLFTIGLEFSLSQLLRMSRIILGAGGGQVLACIAAVAAATFWTSDGLGKPVVRVQTKMTTQDGDTILKGIAEVELPQ